MCCGYVAGVAAPSSFKPFLLSHARGKELKDLKECQPATVATRAMVFIRKKAVNMEKRLDFIKKFIEIGISVIPLHHRSKMPAIQAWEPYKSRK